MAKQPIRLDDLIMHVVNTTPDGDALQHLSDAVATSGHLGEVADHLIGHFVDQARRSGATWTEIGQYMGVSKQAAQKRFVPKDSDDPDFPVNRRLKRFTERARSVIQRSRTEAQTLCNEAVGNEHLVLGLLSEPDGLAARIMVALGAPLEQVRGAILAVLEPDRKFATRNLRFDRATKKTIELSLREALQLGHNYIGTEHLLLGLLRNDRELAAKLLIGLGVTHDKAQAQLVVELERLRKPKAAS
jgi:Clp amino terminal domain, pathogenicity island component